MNRRVFMYTIGGIALIAALLIFMQLQPPAGEESPESAEAEAHYDIIVASGEPEGVAAAVSAARNGAEVLLLEHRYLLGGLMTHGMLNYLDLPQNDDGEIVSQGIFDEWHESLNYVHTVDLEEAEAAFSTLVDNEDNITLQLNHELEDVVMEDNRITGVEVSDDEETKTYTADRVIDATPDGDVAVKAGAPYFIGQQDINNDEFMSVILMIYLDDVDWDLVSEAAEEGVLGGAGIHDYAAWGFPDVLWDYEEETNPEKVNMRGLNIGRTPNEEVFINAMQLFGVDGLDEEERNEAIELGKEETDYFVEWLREELPGFEDAEIVTYPEELYVRETRHIESEYMLPVSALWESEHHWDDIAIGGYEADIQATDPSNYGVITVNPDQYGIPFRSLIPQEVDNLLVASKASGYSSLAAGSARVIPTGMATAEAAGAAGALSIEAGETFRELQENEDWIQELQENLEAQGAYLEQREDPDYPYQGEDFYPALKTLYSHDIIFGGYNNDFRLDEEMEAALFADKVKRGVERLQPEEAEGMTEELEALVDGMPEDELLMDDHMEEVYETLGWGEPPEQDGVWQRKDALLELESQLTS
ncbi:FAD dependent oxidoreductase [Salsuginibacillus halophilus]|uniref:FAD dependent oxidoreductase n=1 Tax=Salsuginibacillus halophilus TaxID=517424 RepID=A0A2P8HQJ8_9BACI|nr:FAD-dependent oxidoreductase [Salsuginibacillus halophilus]PSL48500.1 FAD dependent oxidoreductase [Salsuginibacillus halophilus]